MWFIQGIISFKYATTWLRRREYSTNTSMVLQERAIEQEYQHGYSIAHLVKALFLSEKLFY